MFNILFKSSKQNKIIFKSSDYDLNLDERKVKYKDYDLILCGKCKRQVGCGLFYCEYCYYNETDEEEKNRMKYGKCKGCFQLCTGHNWCSSCGFQNNDNIENQIVFKTIYYDLNRDERKIRFKDYDLIFCGECKRHFDHDLFYCKSCYRKETNEEK